MELAPAGLKRAAFGLQLRLCPGPFSCVGLLPVLSSVLSVGRAVLRGSCFLFMFC